MEAQEHDVRESPGCLGSPVPALLVILLVCLLSCSTTRTFWHKKYPHETSQSLRAKKGLMLLQNTYIGRNRYFYSKNNTKRRFKHLKRIK